MSILIEYEETEEEAARKTEKFTKAEREAPEALRHWRKKKATSLGIPAYMIFHDKTLKDLVKVKPISVEELRRIPGIGHKKAEEYGSEVVEILKRHFEKVKMAQDVPGAHNHTVVPTRSIKYCPYCRKEVQRKKYIVLAANVQFVSNVGI